MSIKFRKYEKVKKRFDELLLVKTNPEERKSYMSYIDLKTGESTDNLDSLPSYVRDLLERSFKESEISVQLETIVAAVNSLHNRLNELEGNQ